MSEKNSTNNPIIEEGVQPQSIVSEMKEAYLDYAMSVIMMRALPDVRDGLKPVHRRILYAMRGMGLTSGAKFRKSAAVVGEVLGKYHPHGDGAVYDSMVNMAQDFSFRYPLVLGQGNFGSIDGDNAAAMRYTEAKMSKISGELLSDIEKDTVNFRDNYDGTIQEPEVLPAAVPGLLLNGTLGIAVGMATNIPPHNLGEVIDGLIMLIDKDNVTHKDLMSVIKGPDFPTGAILFGKDDINEAYASGRGSMVVRGEAEIVEPKAGKFQILIRSLPYRLKKSDLIVKIANLVKDKKVEGIKDIRDESTTDIRIVVELKNSAQPQKILNQLYKFTPLEDKFHLNLVALHQGVPQTMAIKDVLEAFLDHRRIVIRRRTEYELRRAQSREHILLGLTKALDHIDEIIAIIKKSRTRDSAKDNLIKKFKFSDRQVEAILQMQLQRLAGLERKKIEDELKEIQKLIKSLKKILSSEKNILTVVKDELLAIREKYADDRRTTLVEHSAKNFSIEDLIPNTESVLVYTQGGYVKRTDPAEYKRQHRGGVGVVDLNTKDEDAVSQLLFATTHTDLLFFTDRGRVFKTKMYEIPEGRRSTKGKSIMNFLPMETDEVVTSIVSMPASIKQDSYSLFMVTSDGTVKKSDADSFHEVRRSGLISISLKGDNRLIDAFFVQPKDDVMLLTQDGQSIRFDESDVREMGRTAAGVRGIKLKKGDKVVSARVIRCDDKECANLFVITEKGYGKQTAIDEYSVQGRGGSGVKALSVTEKTGPLAAAAVMTEETSEIIAMSANSQVIRVGAEEIPTLGRSTQGVKIMKLRKGDKLSSLVKL
jgi:DNA gyrase subunit A